MGSNFFRTPAFLTERNPAQTVQMQWMNTLATDLLIFIPNYLLRMPSKPHKLIHPTGQKPMVMTTPSKNPVSPSAPQYPAKTTGSEAAASVRKQANGWSEQKRVELFEQGMRMIYGGSSSAAAKVRP